MSDESTPERAAGQPEVYQLRLKGHLRHEWVTWFEGMTVTPEEDGSTLLTGTVIDQAALHGILKRIRDLGMPLLSITSHGAGPQALSGLQVSRHAPIFQIDAFTTRRFSGNPAAVLVLERYPDDSTLQAIAAENNLAETAFLVPEEGSYRIRWFTPAVEVPLCGHATLASAAVVMERLEPRRRSVVFESASGPLPVTRTHTGYILDFPARPCEPTEPPLLLSEALGLEPDEVFVNAHNYLAVVESAGAVRGLVPDLPALSRLDRPGVIVTAPGEGDYDFVSRYFAPAKGIPEDPVTGAAHCMLAPYWSERLGRSELRAFQASRRGGELVCRMKRGRVELEGSCIFYLEGKVEI